MAVEDYYTWNPQVHFQLVGGGIPTQELAERTLSISYIDRLRKFDHIEWELDNSDGKLTQPEFMAGGLLVRLRMGYLDSAFPWKAFIINAVNGGVGVYGKDNPAVGDNERRLRLMGRNRNAPGGNPSRGWSHRSRGGRKRPRKEKIYAATEDVTKHELILSDEQSPRLITAATTSEAVAKIAKKHGFEGSYALIQETFDQLDGGSLAIPVGYTDGEFLAMLADEDGRDFTFKISDGVLHWHSPYWKGETATILPELRYGHGEGITKLSLLADFRLPMPTRMTAMGHDPRRRRMSLRNVTIEGAKSNNDVGTGYLDIVKDKSRIQALTGWETFPVAVTGTGVVDERITERFIRRHRRTMGVRIDVVGDPAYLAGRYLPIGGTGCPFVDRVWSIVEAKHVHNGTTYETQLKLGPPPSHVQVAGSGIRRRMTLKNLDPKPADKGENRDRGFGYLASAPRYKPTKIPVTGRRSQ